MLVQVYPQVYQTALKAADIVQQLSKTGAVDVDTIAMSLTAGKTLPVSHI